MATNSLLLPIAACHLPDGSASNVGAQIQKKTSSGGTLHPSWVEALFDATTDEHIMWSFVMPNNYSSAPVMKVYYKATSDTDTAHTAAWGGAIQAITDADAQDVDADAFDAANVGTGNIPGVAGYLDVISIAMTNADSLVAGDHVVLGLFRDVSGDDVTGDLEVINCELQYSD